MLAVPAEWVWAQSGYQPNLIFSISGGYTTGGRLWTLDKQAVAAPNNQLDSVALARRLRPGFSAVLSATLFQSPHLGYGLEVGLFALGSESRCAPLGSVFQPDADRRNEQTCGSIQGRHIPTSMVAFQTGLTYRVGADGAAQPYLRVAAGFAILGNSFIQTAGEWMAASGSCQTGCLGFVLDAAERTEFVWTATLAAGVALPMGTGYRFRAEVRDAITALPVVTGPADPRALVAETSTSVRHVPALTFGLDVVLERRRTRRY